MLIHCQIFKETQPVADWQPPFSSSGEEDLTSACQRLITRAISSGTLTNKEGSSNPETTTDGRDVKCATFTKGAFSFHACQVMPKCEDNPTGQDLYLICVTRPAKAEVETDDEMPNDLNQQTRERFFDFQ